MQNPFSTTFGLSSTNYILRLKESDEIIENFTASFPSNYVYMILGIRGSGKTVLLSNIAKTLDKETDWLVINLGSKENMMENLASEIYQKPI